MALSNKWLTPLERSFSDIKQKLLDKLKTIKDPNNPDKPLISDLSEGNILVLIISMFSAIAEVLHFYIDNLGRETFLLTARKYTSLLKHAALVDYSPRGATSASADLILTGVADKDIVILVGSKFIDTAYGYTWYTDKEYKISQGITMSHLSVFQYEYNTENLGKLPDDNIISVDLNGDVYYVEGSMELTIGSEKWSLVNSFANSSPKDNHFKVVIQDSIPIIVFGDGIFGKIPTDHSSDVTITYKYTHGSKSNIGSGYISSSSNTQDDGEDLLKDFTINNPLPASGGSDYEDFDTLKRHISLSVNTREVAITKQDFKDLAEMYPGVHQANIEYVCGRKMNIYISAVTSDNGYPVASEGLCQKVKEYISLRSPLTTWLNVKSVSVVSINLDIDVTGNKGYKGSFIRSQIVEALGNAYSPVSTLMGNSVRISDLYALIDNLESVDYLHINKFYVTPWPKVIYGTSIDILSFDLKKANTPLNYIIEVLSSNTYYIYSESGGFISDKLNMSSNVLIKDTKNDNEFYINVNGNSQQMGYKYSIYLGAINSDYEASNYNVALFYEKNLSCNITETV